MANYHLVMQNRDKSYTQIEFTKIPMFNIINDKKLDGIVNFTSYFRDETHLKETLVSYGLIKKENYNNKLVIIYRYKGNIKKLMYGLTYQDDVRFFDYEYIKHYLKSKSNNLEFLEKLCNRYRNSYDQGLNITIIRKYINYIRINDVLDDLEYNSVFNECMYSINDFVRKEVYTYDTKTNTNKVNYRRLRDLAMFLAHDYNKNIKPEILKEEEIKIEEKDIKIKKKTRKNKKQMEGQYSLRDFGVDI